MTTEHTNKPRAWTDADLAALREHYPIGGSPAVKLHVAGRSTRAIQNQAHLMGLTAKCQWWDAAGDALVREHYTDKGAAAVSEMTGRTVLAVRRRAAVLGIKADKARAGRMRVEKLKKENRMPKPKLRGGKQRAAAPIPRFEGEARITSETKVTICPSGIDRRFAFEPPPGWKGAITQAWEQERGL